MQAGEPFEQFVAYERRHVIGDRALGTDNSLHRRSALSDYIGIVFDVPIEAKPANLRDMWNHDYAGLVYSRPNGIEHGVAGGFPTILGENPAGPNHDHTRTFPKHPLHLLLRRINVAHREIGSAEYSPFVRVFPIVQQPFIERVERNRTGLRIKLEPFLVS